MSPSNGRRRTEAAVAILFGAAILLVGGAALYFVFTISVHTDPEAVPSTAAASPADRYADAVAEARRLARSLIVEENLPGLSIAVAAAGQIAWAEGFGWADVERRVAVTPLTIALLEAPVRLESGDPTGYARGWKVDNVQLAGAPARLLSHRGTPIGGTVSLMMFSELGLVIATASNVSYGKGAEPIGLKVADAFARSAKDRARERSRE